MNFRFDYSIKEDSFIKKYSNPIERRVTAFMSKEGQPTAIHCMYCKKTLFECQQNVVMLTPGTPPQELKHLKIRCPNPSCNTTYYFVSAV
jgi:aspartate carbamoyltransferase regulatory subunit